MSADDRNDLRDEQQPDPSLHVEDLEPKALDERAAAAVKGGVKPHDFTIPILIDKPTP